MKHRFLLLAVMLAAGAVAQEAPPAPPAVEPSPEQPAAVVEAKVEVVEVLVDVLAVDRKGNVVPGLGKDDFEVKVEGQPAEVTSVSFYTTRYEDLDQADLPVAPVEGAQVPPAAIPASRYFILFFHDQSHETTAKADLVRNQLRAAREMSQWVRDEMRPSDWVAVVRYDHELTVHTDFTQQQSSIFAAIEQAVLNRSSELVRPSLRKRIAATQGPSLLRSLPSVYDMGRETRRVFDAVRLLADAAGHIVGRKNLVIFTLGFGDVDSPLGSAADHNYRPMEEALNANNVAVYPVDASVDASGGRTESSQTLFLSQLADDTGGEYLSTFTSFADPLRRVADQNTGYYLIGFRAEHPLGERGYRDIEVTSKAKKVRVRARRGYRFGPPAPP